MLPQRIFCRYPHFFRTKDKLEVDKAELNLIFNLPPARENESKAQVEVQMALRLPSRSKPLHISHLRTFIESIRYEEPVFMSSKKYTFSMDSFDSPQKEIVRLIIDHMRFNDTSTSEKQLRLGYIDYETFGVILARLQEVRSCPSVP
jgi:hypothetical protein